MAAQLAAFMGRLLNIFHCNTPLQDNFEQFRLNIPGVSCLTHRGFFGEAFAQGIQLFLRLRLQKKKKKIKPTVSHEKLWCFYEVK